VLAEIEPIDAAFLDPRGEAQARTDVRAAEYAGGLPPEVEQAQAELDFAHSEFDRARSLAQQGSISQRDLDQAERTYRSTGRCCNCCNRARASSKAARP
jgi:HlyD family secretion protein